MSTSFLENKGTLVSFNFDPRSDRNPDFFYFQSSTFPTEALIKVYLFTAVGLSFMISSVAPT